ncbi:VapE domain-containing protein, partial [Bacteroides sp. CAG:633]|uniref:VapE domain-containing protein n=1 Tax=Bacteroides sp. CAG:633 TaxID=1262744 RepID=UPI002589264E
WTGRGGEGRRANSVAPLLVSTAQGLGKSTFCRLLLPPQLRDYFTESFDLTNATAAENKLASYGLINLDEFDRLPASRMPQLKNLVQMEALRVRRAYRRTAEPLPRIASFIGTSNRRDLLTDLSGSRRFICVE